jgi:quinol monooxygenase YgiN
MASDNQPLTVLVELDADPARVDAFRTLIDETLLPDTRGYDGCEHVDEFVDADRPTCVILEQRWSSRGAFDGYLAWRRGNGDLSQLTDLLVAPPTFRYLVPR